jgi:hypothetical protein
MLTVFWDSKGPILEDNPEKGCTMNSASHSDLLANNLKPAIRTKRRGGKLFLRYTGCGVKAGGGSVEYPKSDAMVAYLYIFRSLGAGGYFIFS